MVKKSEIKDPLSLEGITGIGPSGIKALNDEQIFDTLQLVCKTPTFLKDVTGMDRDKAGKAFAEMKKRLEEAGYLSKQEMSAWELLQERHKIVRLRTGCVALDTLLGGGLECKSITEFFGENGSGKTQTSHTLAIMAQRPLEEGGLYDGGNPVVVLYIDTENTCRPERFLQIAIAKGFVPESANELVNKLKQGGELTKEDAKEHPEAARMLSNIIIQKATNAADQFVKVNNASQLIRAINIKLIIVDSATALFRSDFLGRGNTKTKFDLLNEMVHTLQRIAENYVIPIVFINQIYHSVDPKMGEDPDIPYGGNIVGHAIPYRIKLFKSGKKHGAKIHKSPYQANDDVRFYVSEAGLVDIEK
jgi:DNA repair protein RadA